MKDVPVSFRKPDKRQALQAELESMYGNLGKAFEAITSVTFDKCPVKAKKDPDARGFRRYSDDLFEASGAIVHVNDGPVAKRGDFFGMLGGFDGSDGEHGFQLALDHILGCGGSFEVSEEDLAKSEKRRKERDAEQQEKREKNKNKGVKTWNARLAQNESVEMVESYIQQGRGISCFSGVGLSSHISAVNSLPYYRAGDTENNNRKLDALLFPLSKLMPDGTFKIHGLHAIYLEKVNGHYQKADVKEAKQDLPSWDSEPGVACNLSVHGNRSIYIGEGFETVCSYYGAFSDRFGECNNFGADFKFTNTASRLGSADLDYYDVINVLVDRDLSGTGMKKAMQLKHKWSEKGKEVNFLIPPSNKMPIFIYVSEHSESSTIDKCIELCNYYRRIDAAMAEEVGSGYVDRYEAFIVLPKNFTGERDIPYDYIVNAEDLNKEELGKGLDWDDVIKHGSHYAFELQDFFERYKLKNKSAA